MMLIMRILVLSLCLALAACEPMGPLPGNRLSGEVGMPPENWSELNQVAVIQIASADGYSVNLWGVGLPTGYYIASARGPGSKWAVRINRNPAVKLRVEGVIYELTAVLVEDQVERETISDAFLAKYDLEADEDFPEAVIYRLETR